tara:strand:- start:325 stop:954 length:630 start_codon:yes stop_codon:yes gene_type:complete
MKRTKNINLSAMRKKGRAFALAPLALAIVTGCAPEPKEQVKFVTSIDDCENTTSMTQEQCEAAYVRAVAEAERTSPRYQYHDDCTREFGECRRNDDGIFVPMMAGMILSELIDEAGDVMEAKYKHRNTHPVYKYRGSGSYKNKIMTADGHVIGSPNKSTMTVSKSALKPKPKPKVTKTLTRGGFGSKAAAKSSWGSSSKSSSSRGGWGG